MDVSTRWLNEYLDRPVDADEVERVLPAAGLEVESREDLDRDTRLELEVTANRTDCFSHVGIARELAAVTERRLSPPAAELPKATGASVEEAAAVTNDASHGCPQYTARVVRGVRIGPSPQWLADRLEAVGLRPVNNVVDITNLVLHEMGQPLHAFDLHRLEERRIVVRQATAGETITLLDGSTPTLQPAHLVIADASRPVAVAGVMGGADTAVTGATTDILLESARFDPLTVRRTSRDIGVATDSSYRFERGVDPAGVDTASRRAARLIAELAGGTVAEGVIATGEPVPEPKEVSLRPERTRSLLGIDISADRVVELLDRLGLAPRWADGHVRCTIPTHRLDLTREVDLIEEVARLHGYDAIHVEPEIRLAVRPPQPAVRARHAVDRVLTAHGYHEAITFSFVSPDAADAFRDGDLLRVDEAKKPADPALRPSLLPSLLHAKKHNQDVGNRTTRLFEVAKTFRPADGGYAETPSLAMVLDADPAEHALRDVRGTIEELVEALGTGPDVAFVPMEPAPPWAAVAGRVVRGDEGVGTYGVASDDVVRRFDLRGSVVLGELDYAKLTDRYPPEPEVRAVPRYPAIDRDLTVVVDEGVRWADIVRAIHGAEAARLEDVQFVTTFRGKQIGVGRKSVTCRLTFRATERTLTHDEVHPQTDTIVGKLRADVGAELRGG